MKRQDFAQEICISSLEIQISSLKIYISTLKIDIFRMKNNFSAGSFVSKWGLNLRS